MTPARDPSKLFGCRARNAMSGMTYGMTMRFPVCYVLIEKVHMHMHMYGRISRHAEFNTQPACPSAQRRRQIAPRERNPKDAALRCRGRRGSRRDRAGGGGGGGGGGTTSSICSVVTWCSQQARAPHLG